jgi:hypothetical protein
LHARFLVFVALYYSFRLIASVCWLAHFSQINFASVVDGSGGGGAGKTSLLPTKFSVDGAVGGLASSEVLLRLVENVVCVFNSKKMSINQGIVSLFIVVIVVFSVTRSDCVVISSLIPIETELFKV